MRRGGGEVLCSKALPEGGNFPIKGVVLSLSCLAFLEEKLRAGTSMLKGKHTPDFAKSVN